MLQDALLSVADAVGLPLRPGLEHSFDDSLQEDGMVEARVELQIENAEGKTDADSTQTQQTGRVACKCNMIKVSNQVQHEQTVVSC